MSGPSSPGIDGGAGRWAPLLLLVLALVPYAMVLGEPPLWDANEPLYAEPPREVLEHGDVLAPTWNGERWFVHPPLSTWVTVPFYAAFGVSPFSERLPMALAAMGTILLTYALGKAVGGRRVGLLAALVLAAMPRFWLSSRQLAGDVYLTTILLGAFVLAVPALRAQGAGRRRLLGAWALVGFGMLAKGPVIGLLFGVPLLLAAWFARPRLPFRRLDPWRGAALALLVGAPWFVYMSVRFWPDFLSEHFGYQTFRRAFSDDHGWRPPWYYLTALLGDAEPWILVLPLGVARALRAKDRRPEALLPWTAAAFTLVFFSAATGKRNVYLLPMYPMLAIGLAPVLLECWDGARRTLARWAGACLAVGAGGAGVLLVIAAGNVPGASGAELPMTVVCFAAALAALVGCVRASGRTVVVGVVAGALLLEAASALLLPTLGRYRPVPRLAAALAKDARPGDTAVAYGVAVNSLLFYADRRFSVPQGPDENLLSEIPPGKRAYVVCPEEVAERVAKMPALSVREVDRAPYLDTFQFRRLILGQGRPMKDLVLLALERRSPASEGPGVPPR